MTLNDFMAQCGIACLASMVQGKDPQEVADNYKQYADAAYMVAAGLKNDYLRDEWLEPAKSTEDEQAEVLNTRLADTFLSTHCVNTLHMAGIYTIRDLVRVHRSDLLKFKLFGKKCLEECSILLETQGLTFGMNV